MSSVATAPLVVDGTALAIEIKSGLAVEIALARDRGYTPGLAVVLVGEVPASQMYVRNKAKTCAELGIYSEVHTPAASATTEELLELVTSLNAREEIDGILVQLPLPSHVDTTLLLEAVFPAKDVDGFHPINAGRLLGGFPMERLLVPCTPAGIMEILMQIKIPIAGQRAVVLGRSNVVGKPVASMLVNASATVTICHAQTKDLKAITRAADILVVAIGRPGFVTPEMVRAGATIIDVGINRITTEVEVERFFPASDSSYAARWASFRRSGSTIVGDVDPAAYAKAGAYTPVPGGVGALTIAMLMANTVKAARLRRGW